MFQMHPLAATAKAPACAAALGDASIYAAAAPKNLMVRPTRLQKLLEHTPFDELSTEQKDPETSALFASPDAPVRWRPEPSYVPNAYRYFEYFSTEDILLMATQVKYAKKVAGELRVFANLHLGGRTSQFRNDDVHRAAALLADRRRLLTRGIPVLATRADLDLEARHVGLKTGTLSDLSYFSGSTPAELGLVIEPRGDHVESVRGAFASRFGNDQISPGRFLGLMRGISYAVPVPLTLSDPAEVETVLMNALRNNLEDGAANPLRSYAQCRSFELNYLITAEAARAKLSSFDIKYGYEYRLKPIHAIKIPPALGYAYGQTVVAAVPRLPVERIAAWRRIFHVTYAHPGLTEQTRHRANAVPEILHGTFYDVEPWQEFELTSRADN